MPPSVWASLLYLWVWRFIWADCHHRYYLSLTQKWGDL